MGGFTVCEHMKSTFVAGIAAGKTDTEASKRFVLEYATALQPSEVCLLLLGILNLLNDSEVIKPATAKLLEMSLDMAKALAKELKTDPDNIWQQQVISTIQQITFKVTSQGSPDVLAMQTGDSLAS